MSVWAGAIIEKGHNMGHECFHWATVVRDGLMGVDLAMSAIFLIVNTELDKVREVWVYSDSREPEGVLLTVENHTLGLKLLCAGWPICIGCVYSPTCSRNTNANSMSSPMVYIWVRGRNENYGISTNWG